LLYTNKCILALLGNNGNIQSFSESRLWFLRRPCSRRYDRSFKNKNRDSQSWAKMVDCCKWGRHCVSCLMWCRS